MARIPTRGCRSAVPNRCELAGLAAELARELPSPLAREPDHKRAAKAAIAATALRQSAERAADPAILRIDAWRRRKDMPLLGESNDNRPPVGPALREAQAA